MDLVEIPAVWPIVEALRDVPLLGGLVDIILWRPVFAALIAPGALALTIALIFIIWFERKLAARVQWRYGPLEVSRRVGGLLQPVADLLRFMFQEVVASRYVDRPYFVHAPIVAFTVALVPLLFIPIAPGVYGIYTPYNILVAAALLAALPIAILVMGWSSNDRFTYIGTVREALMYVSYEVPLLLSIASMAILYSPDPFRAVEWQSANLPGAVANPLAFIAFAIATAMATSRFPFEIPEAETEIVLGPYTEYSGILFGIAFTIAYEKLYILASLMTLLFLSGWAGPEIPGLGEFGPAVWFLVKVVAVMMFYAFLRAIYARYRIDQALRVGWTVALALSIAALALSTAQKLLP